MASISGFLQKVKTPSDKTKAIQEATPVAADFSQIGGVQSISKSRESTVIEVTNQSSNENREILDGRGIKMFNIDVSGQLQDAQILKDIEADQFNNKLRWFQVEQSDDGNRTITAKCKIINFNTDSAHDGSVTFSLTLQSSGEVTLS